jgi:urea carboxylase-associated protein 1
MSVLLDVVVPAREPFSTVVRRGSLIRIIDLEGQQAVDALFYNAHNYKERYSGSETLAAQRSAYVRLGTVLTSTEANPLATVIENTGGDHDTSAGACSCESNTVRFGHHTRYMHACRENFILELARYGMDRRDITGNVNFFMNVPIRPDGELAIVDGVSAPGDHVTLRAEMDILVVLSNCPQVNNPCNGFNPSPIRVVVEDDAARSTIVSGA